MNERIQELAEQAGLYVDLDGTPWPRAMSAEESELAYKKFAELIVEECVDICKDIDGEDNIDARSGRQDCAVEIREHFGVEE
jgi:hypothetical protein